MIAIAKKQNRHFNAIIVHKFDRFSRSREDHVIYKALLKKHGVYVYSVTEQTDPETPHGFLLEGMLEVISEFYNMNLANETRKGMFENARRGFHNGGAAPYGYRNYRYDHNGTIKTIWVLGPEEEVATVKRIYHHYCYENVGYKKIASMLNVEGIPCPTKANWSFSTVWHILHNEAYIGNRVWNKQDYNTPGQKWKPKDQWIRVENAHPAIVSQEAFNLVKVKSKQKNKNSSPFKASGSPYILRGLFKCPLCGTNMVSGQSGSRGKSRNVRRYYVCGAYQRKGKTVCQFRSFGKERSEQAVIDALIKEFTMLSLPGMLEEEFQRYLQEQVKNISFDLQQTDQEIAFTARRIELLKVDYEKSPNPSTRAYIDELEAGLNQLQNKKKELEKQSKLPAVDSSSIQVIKDRLIYFVRNINHEHPDSQWQHLMDYLESVRYDDTTGLLVIKLQLKLHSDDNDLTLVKKDIYTKY